jgi:sugar O-acyltransferase (sialic acid O-acetyltransferase NeuD family)
MSRIDRSWILLGAGGHAKVVLGLARALGLRVIGVCDPGLASAGDTSWRGIPVIGDDSALAKHDTHEVALLNGIGQVPGSATRKRIHQQLSTAGFEFPALVHPGAMVDGTATLAEGVQVMAGAVVQADASIGTGTIVNTGARVDHDCRIGQHVHIAPGAVLCGGVVVGDDAFLGAACTILPQIDIGPQALVAAGAVLARTLDECAAFLPHRIRWGAIARPREKKS